MPAALDETHDPNRTSWIASAQGHAEFPIQNLPLGIFSHGATAPRAGVAIGESIFDIGAALEAGLFSGEARRAAEAAGGPTLNALLALGAPARAALRRRISSLLAADGPDRAAAEKLRGRLLHEASECALHLPVAIGALNSSRGTPRENVGENVVSTAITPPPGAM